MGCIKCGRDTQGDQLFCLDCQEEMLKYPVKPNTYVRIPERRNPSGFRRVPKRRTVNAEEQIRLLKRKVRDLTIGMILCLLIMAGLLYFFLPHIVETHYKPGQNYSVVTATTAATEPTAN